MWQLADLSVAANHFAYASGNAAARVGYTVLPGFLKKYIDHAELSSHLTTLDKLSRVELLIIDDIPLTLLVDSER
jgi:DNA replication protein DnaC